MDEFDRRILRLLQEDATLSVAEIGRKVGLSSTPCWNRIQKLEAAGVIRKRVAILAPEAVGLGVTVHVNIEAGDHSPAIVESFIEAVVAMPEVLDVRRLAGDVDFALRVVAIDVEHYQEIYRRLTSVMPLRRVSSYFEMEALKSETALPLALTKGAAEDRARVQPGRAQGGR